MNRVYQATSHTFHSVPKTYLGNLFSNHLEGLYQWHDIDLTRSVLVGDHGDRFSLRSRKVHEFVAVSNRTYVSSIRMQKIHRPVLRFFTVITERTSNLEFNRPFIRNQKIGSSLRTDRTAIFGQPVQITSDELH